VRSARRWLGLLAAAAALAAQAADNSVLDEHFGDNSHGWPLDEFSSLTTAGYVIDAHAPGGYARWLPRPAEVRDVALRCELTCLNDAPKALRGVLLRVQQSWLNSYFFVTDGTRYAFGKFVAGKNMVLKEGLAPPASEPAGPTVLEVEARGGAFRLTLGGQPLATVTDYQFAAGGLGLYVESPAKVCFTRLSASPPLPGAAPRRVLFRDDFSTNQGWPVDDYRVLERGAYHLRNGGQAKSYCSWLAATADLGDFEAHLDCRQQTGSPDAFFGLLWRVRDAEHYYFFVINPDGRYYAGVQDGRPLVRRRGRLVNARPGSEQNSLTVRAAGSRFTLALNGVEAASFDDAGYDRGALGLYLQGPADAAFSDLVAYDLAENAPPTVGESDPGPAPAPARGRLRLLDRLDQPSPDAGWPSDGEHFFDQGGYCLKAAADGSATALRAAPDDFGDGLLSVTARPLAGPVPSNFGLVARASADGNSFYFLLLNSAGRYVAGKCLAGAYTVQDLGPAPYLRGGDAGNELALNAKGSQLRYSINDRLVCVIEDDSLRAGRVGLHVERGAVACFRDLRVFGPPDGGH
jgi:hypothetical protein